MLGACNVVPDVQRWISVTTDGRVRLQALCQLLYVLMIDILEDFDGQKAGALAALFDRQQQRSIPSGAVAAFAGAFATDKSIIDLEQTAQSILFHLGGPGGSKLSQHPFCSTPSDANHLGQPSGGTATFVRTHQIDGTKPFARGIYWNSSSDTLLISLQPFDKVSI